MIRPLALSVQVSRLLATAVSPHAASLICSTRVRNRQFCAQPKRQAEARELNQEEPTKPPNRDYDEAIAKDTTKQQRTPWHREGADLPPVQRQRSASAMVKGKLLTTPSRLLKLVVPLSTDDHNADRKNIEPLALVVHPQQPLSYLERLIQSELPPITDPKGNEKIPAVYFKAESSSTDEMGKPASKSAEQDANERAEAERESDTEPDASQRAASLRGGPGEGGVESYSGAGREANREPSGEFVRWSASTEIGDFIRDAARGAEFAIVIQQQGENGAVEREVRVGVPSFRDRTHYLRQRLRKASRRISDMASVKRECDAQAHRAAQRVALTGFGLMVGWWIGVYYLTFRTDLGWDTMEPVTYLVGLSGLMGGYLWFLYHNREVSYRAAMNLTISRRQSQLYEAKGFDAERWEELVREGNALRAEIKAIAAEYDVEWDERADEQDDGVKEALKEERDKRKKDDSDEDKDDDDDSSDKSKKKSKEKKE